MSSPPAFRPSWIVPACLPIDMENSAYSARQRRAINQVWTACGNYQFEPQFLAMRSDGQPDLYMNCVIGLVHKWFGEDLPKNKAPKQTSAREEPQVSLTALGEEEVLATLRNTQLESLTPLQAMNLLYELKAKL